MLNDKTILSNPLFLTRFVGIAIGSLAGTEYLLDFSKRIGYFTEQEYNKDRGFTEESGQVVGSLKACQLTRVS